MYWNVFQEDGIWLATKILTHPSSNSSDTAAHRRGPTTTTPLPSCRDESFRPKTKLSRRSSASIDPVLGGVEPDLPLPFLFCICISLL